MREELQQVRGEAREDGLGAAGAGLWEGEDEGVGAGAPGCGWAGAGGCDLVGVSGLSCHVIWHDIGRV